MLRTEEARNRRSQAWTVSKHLKGTHDKGRIAEEPGEGKLSSPVLEQRWAGRLTHRLSQIERGRFTTHRHAMFALATVRAAVFDIPHLVLIATRQHLGHQSIIVGGLIARMGVGEAVPVVSKDLLEDVPVPRGCCQHRVAPSRDDKIVTVQRLYHTSSAQSTPSRRS